MDRSLSLVLLKAWATYVPLTANTSRLLVVSQAPGGTQAVPPVASHGPAQAPPKTTQAEPGPNSAWQSVSRRQARQAVSVVIAVVTGRSAQKPALPVVSVQNALALLGLQGAFVPTVQMSISGVQPLVS
jgi:hypothetical protein